MVLVCLVLNTTYTGELYAITDNTKVILLHRALGTESESHDALNLFHSQDTERRSAYKKSTYPQGLFEEQNQWQIKSARKRILSWQTTRG